MDSTRIPKIDLHLHLDGAIRPQTVWEVATQAGLDLGVTGVNELSQKMEAGEDCESLTEFLDCFRVFYPAVAVPGCLSRAAAELCKTLQGQNHIYAEIRFAPIFASASWQRAKNSRKDPKSDLALNRSQVFEEMLTETVGILGELQNACSSTFEANLIICFMRDASAQEANLTWDVIRKLMPSWGTTAPISQRRLVGVDLSGDESKYSGLEHAHYFREAAWNGLGITIHAGEAAGPPSVLEALCAFGARRLGHGIRAAEDRQLLDRIIREQIPLEVCPTSNLRTGATGGATHPFVQLLRSDVMVTLNTDDPTICPTNINKEWDYVLNALELEPTEVRSVLENSVRAAFAGVATKVRLMQQIDSYFSV